MPPTMALLTPAEFAALIGMGRKWVYRQIWHNKLKKFQFFPGGAVLIPASELERFLTPVKHTIVPRNKKEVGEDAGM